MSFTRVRTSSAFGTSSAALREGEREEGVREGGMRGREIGVREGGVRGRERGTEEGDAL